MLLMLSPKWRQKQQNGSRLYKKESCIIQTGKSEILVCRGGSFIKIFVYRPQGVVTIKDRLVGA